jgi:hypothetical protein
VDETTLIVAAGLSSYERVEKTGGFLLNLRVPMAAVVRYTATYPVTHPPEAKMSYSHSAVIGNPLALAILMLVFTFLAIRIPKATAKDDGMERVRWLHWTFLAIVILVWLFYFFGGASAVVWVLSIGCLAGIYYVSHLVYDKGWRKWAKPLGGIDVDDGLVPTKPEERQAGPAFQTTGPLEPTVPMAQAGPPTAPAQGQAGPTPYQGAPAYTQQSAYPSSEVVVEMPGGQRSAGAAPQPAAYAAPPPAQTYVIPHQAAQQQHPPQQYAPQPAVPPPYLQPPPPAQSAHVQPPPLAQPPYPQPAVPAPQAPQQQPVMPPTAPPATPPHASNGKNGKPLPPPPPPVRMRCPACQTVFQVPGAPRPLPIKCPKCGRQGMLR